MAPSWLFPQIDAALHHGGAGTTGASLRGEELLLPQWKFRLNDFQPEFRLLSSRGLGEWNLKCCVFLLKTERFVIGINFSGHHEFRSLGYVYERCDLSVV